MYDVCNFYVEGIPESICCREKETLFWPYANLDELVDKLFGINKSCLVLIVQMRIIC